MQRRAFLAACASALTLAGCADRQWPCGRTDVTENPDILEGSVTDFGQAQARISWQGEQTKPLPVVWFVTRGSHCEPAMFGRTVVDGKVFKVTPEEFQRMMAGVKKHVVKLRGGLKKASEPVRLDVVRAYGKSCEDFSFRVAAHATKAFYQALLDGLDPANEAGHTLLAGQRSAVGGE